MNDSKLPNCWRKSWRKHFKTLVHAKFLDKDPNPQATNANIDGWDYV
jgi:hypothetical protein